ncbi:DUF952 domain-containing protein [Marinobacter halodurans]|uniref:DUF952 domain-containing protein n=1 Tax=Marinobacter halodurans TaxID=2528979 RepID=A0ABY1ZIQ9_9GAMM|nr:DUF952 domain-containing protein [Marinobacter halodurans]TBW50750.1 DUF952 domain-containing protein [Marinobacter halodurans]
MEIRHFYRVISAKDWGKASRRGVIEPCRADRRVGLIHLNTRDIVETVATRHFRASEFPVVVELDAVHFWDDLEWHSPTAAAPWLYPMLRRPYLDMGWVTGVHLLLYSERDGKPAFAMKREQVEWALRRSAG